MSHEQYREAVPHALSFFGLPSAWSVTPVEAGKLNWNFRVETTEARLFVRRYRDDIDTRRIEDEHSLIRWVAEREVPVAPPHSS